MLDIIFLSFDEPNAEKNWRDLKLRFPRAMRVHGVKGIANAHLAACRKANTNWFYVVDADAEVLDTFKFGYRPPDYDSDYVHIWHAFNPAIGLDYGYGGVKLFHKKQFEKITNALDFSTTLSKGVKIIDEIACITRFNSDQIRAFRGAFRESVKLYNTSIDASKSTQERRDARERLSCWIDPLLTCDFRNFVVAGATSGLAEAKRRSTTDLSFINDPGLMMTMLTSLYPEIDFNTDPTPDGNNPMKHELFFITRIAGVMYDPYVMENLSIEELRDAISDGQLLSKNWLVNELSKVIEKTDRRPLKVAVLGGWIGMLPLMMFTWELPVSVQSIDLDERANRVAEKINWGFDFSTLTADMYDVDYSQFDIIINTSSEHIPDIPKWRDTIPAGKMIIVQNNDFEEGAGHVSTVKNSSVLRKMMRLSEVHYEGTKTFPQYSRFMLIGKT